MSLYRARAYGVWVLALGLIASILAAVHLGWISAAVFGLAALLTARAVTFAYSEYRIAARKKTREF